MMASLVTEVIGLRVSRETSERLDKFVVLFQKWAAAINLVAPSTLNEVWQRHVADSTQIYQLFPGPHRWLDLGSGGGFPGIITAIFLAEVGDGWVHLVESNKKKAAFLRTALAETGARGSVHAVRIEDAFEVIPSCDALSARALAELPQLLEYCLPWMEARSDARAFFHKGRDYQQELDKAVSTFQFDLIKHQSVVEKSSVVLEITHLSRRNSMSGVGE